MIYHNLQRGFSSLLLVIIVAVAVGGYGIYRFILTDSTEDSADIELGSVQDEEMMKGDFSRGHQPDTKDEGDAVPTENLTEKESGEVEATDYKYQGQILAGDSSPLLQYNQTDFDFVSRGNKLIVLYFYANWCPICRAEFPKMQQAFDELTTDQVVGFQVNYNDSETDSNEVALARKHGVAYQHTKVFVRNGERIGKWPDSWDKNRYLSEIERRL